MPSSIFSLSMVIFEGVFFSGFVMFLFVGVVVCAIVEKGIKHSIVNSKNENNAVFFFIMVSPVSYFLYV
ncbi:hypothetical protein B4079_1624 [Bacillus cereus]|nr:hypothetical protein B4079_1624 [Bacillus cereus]